MFPFNLISYQSGLEIGLALSLFLNLILGMLTVGIFIHSPKKQIKIKNPDVFNLMMGVALGFFAGIIGNMVVSSMLELVKILGMTPLNWLMLFLVSLFGMIIIGWNLYRIIQDSMGE